MDDPSARPGSVERTVDGLSFCLAIVGAIGILLLMFVISANVGARWFAGQGLGGSTELSEVLLGGLVFVGFGYAQRQGTHITTGMLITRLEPRRAAAVQAIGLVFVVVLLIWMVYATGDRAWTAIVEHELRYGQRRVPIWPARTAVFVGFVVMLLATLVTLRDNVRAALGRAPVHLAAVVSGEGFLLDDLGGSPDGADDGLHPTPSPGTSPDGGGR